VGKLVDDVEHPELAAVMGALLDKVVAPDVVRVLGAKPDAGAVGKPQPAPLGLLLRYFEPLAAPDPLDPFVVDQPAGIQQRADLAVAIAAVLACQLDQVGGERLLVFSAPRRLALCRAMLSERPACPALGDIHRLNNMLNTGARACGAYQFPEAAS